MLLQPDCVPCIQKALLSAIRELTSDQAEIKALLSEVMQLPSLSGPAWDLTSPHVLEAGLAKISQVFGTSDPFQAMKERQNARAMDLYSWLVNAGGKVYRESGVIVYQLMRKKRPPSCTHFDLSRSAFAAF